MPDGSSFPQASQAEAPQADTALSQPMAPAAVPPRFGRAACAAMALHLAVVLPLILLAQMERPAMAVEAVEIAPMMEEASTEESQSEEVAETAQAPSADPVQAAAPPPDPVQTTETEPETAEPPPPVETVQTTTPPPDAVPQPPEPVQAALAPLDPTPSETPDDLAAVATEDVVTAALPEPPPPMPDPPPPKPRPVHRPRVHHPPTPTPTAAPAAPVAAAAPAAPSSPTQAARASHRPPQSYISALLRALERHKEYPMSARFRRAEGVAMLRFSMRRDGTVSSWRIERSSGDTELDAAVAQMVRRASPLPAPPAEMAGDPIEMVVPVRFTLR